MKIVIIGGSGHVSGALCRAALAKGHAVWALTRGARPLPEGARGLVADRHDLAATESAIAGAGTTWNLAVDCIGYDPADVRQDIALFRERAGRFVFVSTDFVYEPAQRRFPQPAETERYVTSPEVSDYGRKKRLAELELVRGDTGEMGWTVARPCHIYGPTSELGCLPLHGRDADLIPRLRAGEPIRLVGGGHFLQQPILADDLAETILSAASADAARGRCFNTAGPDIVESRRYYEIVADALGVGLEVEEVPVGAALAEQPTRAPFLCHRIYDLAPLAEAGLVVPATPLEEGLRRHVEGLIARRPELAG